MRGLVLILALLLSATPAAAQRIALLIGNGDYQHTSRLRSPGKDVGAMRKALEGLGFQVETLSDASRRAMGRAIRAFSRRARKADTAFFYYSGHGMEIAGRNYLVPVDAQLEEEADAGLEAIGLGDAVLAASGAKRLSLVVLDACRDNRFASATKNGVKGFRPIEAKRGQLIAFATAPGRVAYDGDSALSPFTQALTEVLADKRKRSLDVRLLFGGLGKRVSALAKGRQDPFTHSTGFGYELVTLTGAGAAVVASPPPPKVEPAARPVAVEPAVKFFAARLRALPQGRGMKECGACPEMVAIPGGSFHMGSIVSNALPLHRVRAPAFALGKYEVTFAEWDSCAADGFCRKIRKGGDRHDGDQGWGRGLRPVITVSWNDIKGEAGDGKKGFLAWLNSKVKGAPYRLPTEAEWEYAARAGSSKLWSFGNRESALGDHAWFAGNSGGKTHPVGGKKANAFGLHDMHGNVYEWVEDCWNRSYAGAPKDGSAWRSGDCSRAILRSGSWKFGSRFHHSGERGWYRRVYRGDSIGFRVARRISDD